MAKKIGFTNYQEEDNPEEEKKKEERKKVDAVAGFLKANFSPIGPTSQKVYKTSAELSYMLENIIYIRPGFIAKVLSEAGYRIEYISGQPYWVMYEKNPEY